MQAIDWHNVSIKAGTYRQTNSENKYSERAKLNSFETFFNIPL